MMLRVDTKIGLRLAACTCTPSMIGSETLNFWRAVGGHFLSELVIYLSLEDAFKGQNTGYAALGVSCIAMNHSSF